MVELSPEERQRIHDEETIRLEAKREFEESALHVTEAEAWKIVVAIIAFAIMVWALWTNFDLTKALGLE